MKKKFLRFLEKKLHVWNSDKKKKRERIKSIYQNIQVLGRFLDGLPHTISEIAKELSQKWYWTWKRCSHLEKTHVLRDISEKNKKKNYILNIPIEIIEKIHRYCICSVCGKYVRWYGGIVHENVCQSPPVKVFCSEVCKKKWIK